MSGIPSLSGQAQHAKSNGIQQKMRLHPELEQKTNHIEIPRARGTAKQRNSVETDKQTVANFVTRN